MTSLTGMKKGKMELVEPNTIRTDLETQSRIRIDRETVELYASLMRKGVGFPRILLFRDKSIEGYILIDGRHRLEAHKLVRPDYPIQAEVVTGTLEEARWFSYGMNATHGLTRSNADKNRAVCLALQHKMGADKSNCEIADHVGVDEKLVRRVREQLESTSALPKSSSRVGRDGRTINTEKIGKSKKPSDVKRAEIVVPNEVGEKKNTTASENSSFGEESIQSSDSSVANHTDSTSEATAPGSSGPSIFSVEPKHRPVEWAPYLLAYDVITTLPGDFVSRIPCTHIDNVFKVRQSEVDHNGILNELIETAFIDMDDETQEILLRNAFRARYANEDLADKIMDLVAEENKKIKQAESR